VSRKAKEPQEPSAAWLAPEQQRAWLAYMRVQLRMTYEMNRQLQSEHDLSLGDYDVLVALSNAEDGRLQLTTLAATIGWERSRVSHHLKRMAARGLVDRCPSTIDRRATDAQLTDTGRAKLRAAAPDHVEVVRELFFAGIDEQLLPALTEALEQAYARILDKGTLPSVG
jgi:DNA-binding MarR family transcriptional regulator